MKIVIYTITWLVLQTVNYETDEFGMRRKTPNTPIIEEEKRTREFRDRDSALIFFGRALEQSRLSNVKLDSIIYYQGSGIKLLNSRNNTNDSVKYLETRL